MRLLFLLLVFFFEFLSASQNNYATKDDINNLRDDIKIIYHQIDKRMELMQKNSDKRFEQVDKRFDQVDKRFEQVDKRIKSLEDRLDNSFRILFIFLSVIVTISVAGFGIIINYLLKERNSIKKEIKEELEPELLKKADKEQLEKVVEIIESYAKVDNSFREVLEKHHLKYIS